MEQERRYYRPRRYRLPDGRDWFGDESSGFPEEESENGVSKLLSKPEELDQGEKDV